MQVCDSATGPIECHHSPVGWDGENQNVLFDSDGGLRVLVVLRPCPDIPLS